MQVAGILLATLALAMFAPMTADLLEGNDDWQVFLGAGFLTFFVGMGLYLTNRTGATGLTVRQAFLLTTIAWVVLCAFAALPFAFADLGLDYADAVFEATAGLTTTGATVVTDLESRSTGILLWRALLQWMGGIGIIVTAVAVLPMLRIAGMQLFSTESSDQEKMLPRTVRIVAVIATVYAVLSALCFVAYRLAGMPDFDALAHAMTTVSTAGFSTRDGSIGAFDSARIEAVAMVFMALGALPFFIYMQMARGRFAPLWRDVQLRLFAGIVVTAVALLTLQRALAGGEPLAFWPLLREVAFNVVAIATTTGYATRDFAAWGGFATALFFILLFLGGCTGSTAGGIKMFRIHVLAATLYIQLRRLTQPTASSCRTTTRRPSATMWRNRSPPSSSSSSPASSCSPPASPRTISISSPAPRARPRRWAISAPASGPRSALRATMPACPTAPSCCCASACCWAGWNSSPFSCC